MSMRHCSAARWTYAHGHVVDDMPIHGLVHADRLLTRAGRIGQREVGEQLHERWQTVFLLILLARLGAGYSAILEPHFLVWWIVVCETVRKCYGTGPGTYRQRAETRSAAKYSKSSASSRGRCSSCAGGP